MTKNTHLEALLGETPGELGKRLIEEFAKLVRDPDVSTINYSVRLRALMDERLQPKLVMI